MFGNSEEKESHYKVELFSKGAPVKNWMIKGEFDFEDDFFTAETTSGKALSIALGKHDTLVIEEI